MDIDNEVGIPFLDSPVGTALEVPDIILKPPSNLNPDYAKVCFDMKMETYTTFFIDFHAIIANYESAIANAINETGAFGIVYKDKFENLLIGLADRPKNLKMGVVQDIDELTTFCRAVTAGWLLWPDYWLGLQKIVDYLANDVVIEDVKRMDREFLLILKKIATHEEWPNDPVLGAGIASQAKKIVFRYKSTTPEDKELLHVKTMPTVWSAGVTPKEDHVGKRICDGVDCLEVEGKTATFSRCGKCRKVAYHSKECQGRAWKSGHRRECKPPGK